MAKSQKPLKILSHESRPLAAYAAKGHVVHYYPGEHDPLETYDLVFGPKMWRMVDGLENMVEIAIRAARAVKYTKRKVEDDE